MEEGSTGRDRFTPSSGWGIRGCYPPGRPASTVPDPSVHNSLEGRSMGRQQDQKSHQGNYMDFINFGSGYRKNHRHRSFNGRDVQQHQQMHPTMINPRNNHTSPPAAPLPDHSMSSTIAKQIEYYFSPASLSKNISLRQHMDEQGWVPVSLISGFRQVDQLLEGIPDCIEFILDAVRQSTIVETKGDMIRKRNDWKRWIFPSGAINVTPNPVSQGASEGNQMKDYLREFSAWDKIEDIRNSFFNFTCELPIRMEVHDKKIVLDAMKELRDGLQDKYKPFKQKLDEATKSYSRGILELVDKHSYVVDMATFQGLLSDAQKMRLEQFETTIAENQGKMPKEELEPDEDRLKTLHQELLQKPEDDYKSVYSKVVDYDQMICFVDSFISIVRNKDIV